MTDFEKYLKNHETKQKTGKGIYYVAILVIVSVASILTNLPH